MPRAIAAAAAASAILGGIVLLAVVAVTTVNVGAFALDRLLRPFGGAVGGLPGYEDFVRLAVGGAALSFLPWCQLRRGHVAADLLAGRLPAGATRGLERFWCGVVAAAAAFLAVTMLLGMLEARADGVLSPVLGWPEWPFRAPGVVALGLWALVAARQTAGPDEGDATRG